jgi:hypothetical protein
MGPDQGWDFISIMLGGTVAFVLVVVFGVPIAKLIRDKLHDRQMRQHFSDTRGRRRRVENATYMDDGDAQR